MYESTSDPCDYTTLRYSGYTEVTHDGTISKSIGR
jgi:hypothetical protein